MHVKTLLLFAVGAVLGSAAPQPQGFFPVIEFVPDPNAFQSGQPARTCAIDPPNAVRDNVCFDTGDENTSICCPAGSACAFSVVGLAEYTSLLILIRSFRILSSRSDFSASDNARRVSSNPLRRKMQESYRYIDTNQHLPTPLK